MPAREKPAPLDIVEHLSDAQVRQLHALYQNEWWTKDRTLEQTRSCVEGSQICLGFTDSSGQLAGFGRVLTDFTFKALIFDVIIAPEHRGRGLGDELVAAIMNHPKLAPVSSFELYCLPELVPFYERHGFSTEIGGLQLLRCLVDTNGTAGAGQP